MVFTVWPSVRNSFGRPIALAMMSAAALLHAVALHAQQSSPTVPRQTEADAYTRYELLAPGSAKFRIVYDVTATTAGARYYFNPIRTGSIATDERVFDRATGKPLLFDVVGGAIARAGGVRVSDSTQQYIRVTLARPVPDSGGEARVLIDNAKSCTSCSSRKRTPSTSITTTPKPGRALRHT